MVKATRISIGSYSFELLLLACQRTHDCLGYAWKTAEISSGPPAKTVFDFLSSCKMSANSVSSSVLIDCIEEICLYFDRGEVGEVDFMPTTTSPFVLVDSKVLGISYGILKPLYKYVYTEQFRVYSQYKASSHSDPLSLHQMYQFSTVALVVKGDLAMAYNIRKVVLFHNPTLLSKELIFLQAIFTKHPKSPSGWEHRRWCYNRRYTPSPITPPPYTPIHTHTMHTTNPPNIPSPAPSPAMRLSASEVETERELCRAGSERSPKNYWAWTHRLWLLVHMTQHQVGFMVWMFRR
ncbi:hypothetical protein EON63_02880 [archaeon]|nr:MAG: hypothetical protein EON63_02880 [archaeon]